MQNIIIVLKLSSLSSQLKLKLFSLFYTCSLSNQFNMADIDVADCLSQLTLEEKISLTSGMLPNDINLSFVYTDAYWQVGTFGIPSLFPGWVYLPFAYPTGPTALEVSGSSDLPQQHVSLAVQL